MENQNRNSAFSPLAYPWYDDRVKVLHEMEVPGPFPPSEEPERVYCTPKEIYGYLDQHVWKQAAAKKAASVIAYNCFERGIKSNAMFVGPTGCGKTYIWRCLQEIFPDRIEIVDGSNLTTDGWKGDKKWSSLFNSPIFRSGEPAILVIDEADKMLAPKISSAGENVSHSVQSEGLKMLEGTYVNVKENGVTYQIDTSQISFVLCGAFSVKAAAVAEKERGCRIGFGAAPGETKAYDKPLTEADFIKYGVLSEFIGRIQRIVGLEAMTVDDYYKITDRSSSFLQRIMRQYQADIGLTEQMRHELAETAESTGLGIRGMENQIRTLLDDAIFDNCEQRCFEF